MPAAFKMSINNRCFSRDLLFTGFNKFKIWYFDFLFFSNLRYVFVLWPRLWNIFSQTAHDVDIEASKIWFIGIQLDFDESELGHNYLDVRSTFPWPTTNGFIYFYGQPRRTVNIFSLVSIFSPSLWTLILISIVCSFAFLKFSALIYGKIEVEGLVIDCDSLSLFLRILASLTEPDSMNVFPRWCTGKQKME